jgi:uncharacterized membrane protein (DUF373 family)
MRKMIEKLELPRVQVMVKVGIAFLLFFNVKDLHTVDTVNRLVIALLEFIIVLEIVRMLIDFVMDDEHRIRLRLMIDSTIVFFIRDVMLIANEKFDETKIFSLMAVIAILFVFRFVAMRFTPSLYLRGKKVD